MTNPDLSLRPRPGESAEDVLARVTAAAKAPQPDIELQGGSEFMVTGCYALTPAGEEFIDAYVPGGDFMEVVDAGRIVLPDVHMPRFREKAEAAGLRLIDTKAQV